MALSLSPNPTAQPAVPEKKPRSQKRQRNHRMVLHFNDAEYAACQARYESYRNNPASRKYGDSVSAFGRWCVIGRAARRLPSRGLNPALSAESVAVLGGLLMELRSQGNNLNQLTRHANAGRLPDAAGLAYELEEIHTLIEAVKSLLGLKD